MTVKPAEPEPKPVAPQGLQPRQIVKQELPWYEEKIAVKRAPAPTATARLPCLSQLHPNKTQLFAVTPPHRYKVEDDAGGLDVIQHSLSEDVNQGNHNKHKITKGDPQVPASPSLLIPLAADTKPFEHQAARLLEDERWRTVLAEYFGQDNIENGLSSESDDDEPLPPLINHQQYPPKPWIDI